MNDQKARCTGSKLVLHLISKCVYICAFVIQHVLETNDKVQTLRKMTLGVLLDHQGIPGMYEGQLNSN